MAGFQAISERPAEAQVAEHPAAAAQAAAVPAHATRLVLIALKALSERALVALSNLFSLLLAGSVFWLAYTALPGPTTQQITVVGLYGVFVLALHLVKRKV